MCVVYSPCRPQVCCTFILCQILNRAPFRRSPLPLGSCGLEIKLHATTYRECKSFPLPPISPLLLLLLHVPSSSCRCPPPSPLPSPGLKILAVLPYEVCLPGLQSPSRHCTNKAVIAEITYVVTVPGYLRRRSGSVTVSSRLAPHTPLWPVAPPEARACSSDGGGRDIDCRCDEAERHRVLAAPSRSLVTPNFAGSRR